jgi:hypothetical protein
MVRLKALGKLIEASTVTCPVAGFMEKAPPVFPAVMAKVRASPTPSAMSRSATREERSWQGNLVDCATGVQVSAVPGVEVAAGSQ